jgi:TRAP transporter TAXI family solute receptor
MRSRLVPAAAIAALVVMAGTGSLLAWKSHPWVFSAGQTLRIATIPVNGIGRKFLSAMKREIASEHTRVQLSLIETPNVWASAQALKEQKVDAAVVRSDDPAVADGRTIFVLRAIYAALLVPAQASIDGVSKLQGKKIGVLTDDTGIDPMAKVVLDFYGFDEKQIVRLGLKDLPVALQHRQVAALLVVGPSGAGPITEAVEAFRKSTKKPPKFLDLAEATAITDRFAAYDEAEIKIGAFSGSPAVPPEKVTTISANVLLVAQASLSNYAAGEITRLLLATKTRVAATLPEAGQLAAPSTDKDELLPAHPGTVAFLNGDQTNLLEESMNWILLGSMLTGFVGSLAAWRGGLRNKKIDDELHGRIGGLPLEQAQTPTSVPRQLGAIKHALDQLSQRLMQKSGADETPPEELQAVAAKLADITALVQEKLASPSLDHEAGEGRQQPGETKPSCLKPLRLIDMDENCEPGRPPNNRQIGRPRPPADAA